MSNLTTAREIILSLPTRFAAARAEGYEAIIHLDVEGDRGGQFTVEIKNGTCVLKEGFQGEPNCTVKTKDEVYEEVELGKTNAQMAVMMGKIKISNLMEMMKFIGMFHRIKS